MNNETSFTSLKSYYEINIVACYMQHVYFFSLRQRYYTKMTYLNVYICKVGVAANTSYNIFF